MDAYEAMPVEAFGDALLRGMGWAEGKPVGRNSTARPRRRNRNRPRAPAARADSRRELPPPRRQVVVKPIEYLARPTRLGLGAAPAPPAKAT